MRISVSDTMHPRIANADHRDPQPQDLQAIRKGEEKCDVLVRRGCSNNHDRAWTGRRKRLVRMPGSPAFCMLMAVRDDCYLFACADSMTDELASGIGRDGCDRGHLAAE